MLDAQSDLYRSILDNLSEGVYFVDTDRRITYWNRGAEQITGYRAEEVIGKHCADCVLVHVDDLGRQLCLTHCPLSASISTGQTLTADVYLHHKDGHRVPVEVRVAPIVDENGAAIGAVESFSDNTAKIAARERIQGLEEQALLCPLTKVGNRRYARMSLETRLNEFRRYNWRFGVLFVDIDHFKQVNDTHGHDVGDEALKMVSKSLLSALRDSDFVSRWGGEEFLIVLHNTTADKLAIVAERCRALTESSILDKDSVRLRVTISIGATLVEPEDSVDTILRRADQLLYQSKAAGRNRVSLEMPPPAASAAQ